VNSWNLANLPSRFTLRISAAPARSASSPHLLIQLLPIFPGSVQAALEACELPTPVAHDADET
jgi:hypothetical protein